ncbi:Putative inorganic phosphate cotransporter [Gryllus bimaculatus]|nr:Putative inorganic phosphate cotransporter [Gryllus bimaculatus]
MTPQGVTYPCIHALWARWAPPQERARLATFAFSGSYVGTVVSLPVCGLLANTAGWPSIFYVFGALGVLWFVTWIWQVREGPELDSRISNGELEYIQRSLGDVSQNKDLVHPWGKFLTSLPVWAIVCAHFCENWGFYTLLTQLPKFMNSTLNFDLKKAGFLSAVPYLVMAIILQGAGQLADWLVNRKLLTVTQVRKVFNCVSFGAQTIFMLLAAHLRTAAGVVSCLSLAVGIGAFAWSAFSVNHLDVAPQHASVLMGLSNTVATLPGIISPTLTGYIVQSNDDWSAIFYIASAIYLFGAIFYAVFASGERQSWAKAPPSPSPPAPANGAAAAAAAASYANPALELEAA